MGTKQIQQQIMQTDYSDPDNLLIRSKAIRWKCIDCTCGQRQEIRTCTVKTCPLWPYRLGSPKHVQPA